MRNIKVAIVDDHTLFNEGVSAMMKGFEGIDLISQASSGAELIESIKKKEPDVILMDLKMKDMDGFEVTKYVKLHYPEVKIIALTMHDEERFIIQMMEEGANAYLLKNADPEEMEDAIYSVVQTGYYFNDNVSRAMLKGLISNQKIKPTFSMDIELSEKELDVLELICKEYTNEEIGNKLFRSRRTIDGHRSRLLEKIGVRNTVGLVVYAMKKKLFELL